MLNLNFMLACNCSILPYGIKCFHLLVLNFSKTPVQYMSLHRVKKILFKCYLMLDATSMQGMM